MKTFKEWLWPLFGLLLALLPVIAFLTISYPYSVLTFFILTLGYGTHMGVNKKFPEWARWLWFLGSFLTGGLLLPLYWYFGILVPFLDSRPKFKVKQGRIPTFLLSILPFFAFLFTQIALFYFPEYRTQLWAGFSGISAFSLLYFVYHVFRYRTRSFNKELAWVLSFFLSGTTSLPIYWYKRIYSPTLFPANVEFETHDLWDDSDEEVAEDDQEWELDLSRKVDVDVVAQEIAEADVKA